MLDKMTGAEKKEMYTIITQNAIQSRYEAKIEILEHLAKSTTEVELND